MPDRLMLEQLGVYDLTGHSENRAQFALVGTPQPVFGFSVRLGERNRSREAGQKHNNRAKAEPGCQTEQRPNHSKSTWGRGLRDRVMDDVTVTQGRKGSLLISNPEQSNIIRGQCKSPLKRLSGRCLMDCKTTPVQLVVRPVRGTGLKDDITLSFIAGAKTQMH